MNTYLSSLSGKHLLSGIISCLLLLIGTSSNLQATTYISRHIEEDSRWTKANSPYIITIDLLVAKGVKLEIEAGVKVYFSKETRLVVSGNLMAKGSKQQKILFTGLEGGSWNGFLFTKECNDYNPETKEGVCLEHCTFVGTGEAPANLLRSKGCNLHMSHSTIEQCYTALQTERQAEIWVYHSCFKSCNRVINVRNTSLATLEHNKMTACNSIMLGGTTTFRHNTLKKFTGQGRHSGLVVWMLGGGIVTISHNQFIRFESTAIKLYKMSKRSSFLVYNNNFKHNQTNLKLSCKYYNKGTSKVERNNFYNFKAYHIELFAPCADTSSTLVLGSNYWGRMDEQALLEAILDQEDDKKLSAKVACAAILNKAQQHK